jgi:hypothetical protein
MKCAAGVAPLLSLEKAPGAWAMSDESWETVEEVYGELQAEILRGLLEAQGIPVYLNQEGAGRAYGLNVGPLGGVQLMVPASLLETARQVLEDYYAGKFEGTADASGPDEDGSSEN